MQKTFDKIQYPFMIKMLNKMGREGMYLNIIKAYCDSSIASHCTVIPITFYPAERINYPTTIIYHYT